MQEKLDKAIKLEKEIIMPTMEKYDFVDFTAGEKKWKDDPEIDEKIIDYDLENHKIKYFYEEWDDWWHFRKLGRVDIREVYALEFKNFVEIFAEYKYPEECKKKKP